MERRFTLLLPSDARLFTAAMAIGAGLGAGAVSVLCVLAIVGKVAKLMFGGGA